MRLWTLQDARVVEPLAREARVGAQLPRIVDDHLDPSGPAHRWMAAQLALRIGGLASTPFWAWDARRCPRLNQLKLDDYPEPLVRLDLDVPEEFVLLSQFHLWEEVMCGSYVSADRRGSVKFEQLSNDGALTTDMIQSTWPRVLDLDYGAEGRWAVSDRRWIQGCIPYLDRGWVRSVRRVRQLRVGCMRRSCAISWTSRAPCSLDRAK
jgi:hypothetical protein